MRVDLLPLSCWSRINIVMDLKENLLLAIEAAKNAGQIILQGYSAQNTIDIKENKSQVTEIDKNSEKVIIQTLEAGSNYKILAEETRSEIGEEAIYWAVDPLDGTTNFIRRIPLCGVSIALIKDGQPVIGVMFNPILNELFTAIKGEGAFLNEAKISCSEESGIVFANSGYNSEHKEKFAQIVAATTNYSVRKFGSTAYELACVARGSADAFVAWGDELWDHAAGILLVQEAGGIVNDWNKKEWSSHSNYVCASNKVIQDDLQVIIASVIN